MKLRQDMPEMLARLTSGEFGAIVSSNICSEIEIVNAMATGRFYVDRDGYGFVLRSKEWLESRESAYLMKTELDKEQ